MRGNKVMIRWRSALLGMGVGVVSMICASAAGAGMMAKGAADMTHMDIWAVGILVGSALCGVLTAMCADGGMWEGVLAALGELVVLLALNAVLNGGEMEGFVVTTLALTGGCGGAMLLCLGKGSGRKRRHRHRKNR